MKDEQTAVTGLKVRNWTGWAQVAVGIGIILAILYAGDRIALQNAEIRSQVEDVRTDLKFIGGIIAEQSNQPSENIILMHSEERQRGYLDVMEMTLRQAGQTGKAN